MGQRYVIDMIMAKMEKSRSTKNESQRRTAMSDWITDRRPIEHDESYVYDSFGHVCHRIKIANGQAWKPIPNCEPYVKPKRARVVEEQSYNHGGWEYAVTFGIGTVARHIPTREAAERIAAIYEEVMP